MNYKDIKVIAARHFGADLDHIVLRQYGNLWLASKSHGDNTTLLIDGQTGSIAVFETTQDAAILSSYEKNVAKKAAIG